MTAKQWLSHGNDVILYLDIEDIYVQVAFADRRTATLY